MKYRGKLTVLTTTVLTMIIGFSVLYEPEPRVVLYREPQYPISTPWLTYRVDTTHNGVAPLDCRVDEGLVLEWRTRRLNRAEYSASKSSPAVDNDNLYLGLDTGALVAVNRLTGRIIWSHYTRFSKNGIHGSPTVDSERGQVYIGAYDGWLYAVDRESGDLVWESNLGDFIGSSPTLFNDTLYIGVEMRGPDGYLVGVDAESGREVFRSESLGNHPHSTPTVDPYSGCVFIGENDGYLHCYWLLNQSERWRFKTGGAIKSTVAVNGGVVYVTSWSGSLNAINISSGISIWTHIGGYRSMSSPTITPDGSMIYYGDHGGNFYAVNSSTGERIWSYQTGERIMSSPTLVHSTGTVIIGSHDGYVYLLDSATGDLKQKLGLNSGLTSVPVTVDDHLYVFDHLGYLYSFIRD